MKKFKSFVALMMACMMAFVFTACSSFDASALVKANLDFYKTGEVTEEILKAVNMSEEDLTAQYEEEFSDLMDEMVDSLDADDYINNGGREQVEAFMKAYLGACKYEVAEEATEEDDSYTVEVTAYKMDFDKRMTDFVNGEWTESWTNKIQDGSYKFTTTDQLMNDMYSELFPKFTEILGEVEYDEEGTPISVKVEKNDDGVYVPDEDDLVSVLSACMGM